MMLQLQKIWTALLPLHRRILLMSSSLLFALLVGRAALGSFLQRQPLSGAFLLIVAISFLTLFCHVLFLTCFRNTENPNDAQLGSNKRFN